MNELPKPSSIYKFCTKQELIAKIAYFGMRAVDYRQTRDGDRFIGYDLRLYTADPIDIPDNYRIILEPLQ